MRGVGGPLLCVGDLLADLADGDGADGVPLLDLREMLGNAPIVDRRENTAPPPSAPEPSHDISSFDPLLRLFEENYNELINSLKQNDPSWTSLAFKLCTTLETAYKSFNLTNSNIELLLDKLNILEAILKKGDLAVANAREILKGKCEPPSGD